MPRHAHGATVRTQTNTLHHYFPWNDATAQGADEMDESDSDSDDTVDATPPTRRARTIAGEVPETPTRRARTIAGEVPETGDENEQSDMDGSEGTVDGIGYIQLEGFRLRMDIVRLKEKCLSMGSAVGVVDAMQFIPHNPDWETLKLTCAEVLTAVSAAEERFARFEERFARFQTDFDNCLD